MKRLTARVITSGGSAMCESFSNIIQDGNFVTDCAKFWTRFTQRCDVLNILRPRLLSAARPDRQLRMHEALPRSDKRKRDRSRILRRRWRPETRKSRREPHQPSTKNLPVCDPCKYAPNRGSHLVLPRLHRSPCLPPFQSRCASNRIGRSFPLLVATNVRSKGMALCRPRSMPTECLVRRCNPHSFELVTQGHKRRGIRQVNSTYHARRHPERGRRIPRHYLRVAHRDSSAHSTRSALLREGFRSE